MVLPEADHGNSRTHAPGCPDGSLAGRQSRAILAAPVNRLILILDPDAHTRSLLVSVLAENGFDVESIGAPAEWPARLSAPRRPALLLVDAGQVPETFLADDLSIPVLYLVPPGLPAADIPEPPSLCYGYVEKNSESAPVVLRAVQAALQRRVREQTIDSERQAYRFFFEHIPIAAVVSDPDYVVRHWNHGAEDLFGYNEHEAVGRVLMELLGSPRNEIATNAVKHAFFPGGERRFSLTLRAQAAAAGDESGQSAGDGAGGMCEYRLENSGRLFPEGVDFENTTSLGLRLVHSLAEQLGATLELERSPSTCFILRFDAASA